MIGELFDADSQAPWFTEFDRDDATRTIDGLISVENYDPLGRPPEEVATMERALTYNAHSVFFEAGRNGRAPVPQALVYVSKDGTDDATFAQLHKRLWSWGGVPLLYRKVPGQIQLFRCAHDPDFLSKNGAQVCKPFKTLDIGSRIAELDAWWDAEQIRNGTLWDDPNTCRLMLSARRAAHRTLVEVVRNLHEELTDKRVLAKQLRRRLLILSLLIAYLEERGVLEPNFFASFLPGADRFFHVLGNGKALIALLGALEGRFNGNVFTLSTEETATLRDSTQLKRFARLVEGHEEPSGQLTFWRLYSFKDLPVELLSQIYQLFVKDSRTSVYTPPKLVRLMLEEALSWERLDDLVANNAIILDPACGSGVFLVEAYKRLVLHWRSRNRWKKPNIKQLQELLTRVQGIDLEEAAVELAAFSLCLALCDALEREEIRASVNLFPKLANKSLHNSCFFEAKEGSLIDRPIGAVVGNPPFESRLTTPAAKRSYDNYTELHGPLADKQLAYLFLHEAMMMVSGPGVLCMVQPAGFLYNQHARSFRQNFFTNWSVWEVLDFISVRGLFKKGDADPKVVVIVASSDNPVTPTKLLHAIFRRNGRATGEQGFDIDYYDMHWLESSAAFDNNNIWRANLLGGGRMLTLLSRLRGYRTLGQYASDRGWDFGEGYIAGEKGISNPADHVIGKSLLPTTALSSRGIDASAVTTVPNQPIKDPKSASRFTPPMLLVKAHQDLYHGIWNAHYLTYKAKIVGFAASASQLSELLQIENWLSDNITVMQAYTAGISLQLFNQRATSIGSADIMALPYPKGGSLELSENERILVDDVVRFGRDFIRKGSDSAVMREGADKGLALFSDVFATQLNTIYPDAPIKPLKPHHWPGIVCQPFSFGAGHIDWTGVEQLRGKLDGLLREERGAELTVTRIARIYDGSFIFLLKPDRLRFWLRSVALRDADDVLADLRAQGL